MDLLADGKFQAITDKFNQMAMAVVQREEDRQLAEQQREESRQR